MTGFGEARRQEDGLVMAVELRTINNRYFKLNLKCPDGYGALESQIEAYVRDRVKRGTVQLNLRVDRGRRAEDYKLNAVALASYREQLEALHVRWHMNDTVNIENLLVLPGVVVDDRLSQTDLSDEWPRLEPVLAEGIAALNKMRAEEGAAMAADLRTNLASISRELEEIQARAPKVVDAYRGRLTERLKSVLAEYQVSLDPSDVIREVSLFAERSDISEEIVRLKAHLEQFESTMGAEESSGRKLDFVTQEMGRETNTIGSKANDVQIARHVVEIKATIEKIREMVQNLE
jgi:uncharacterized protein (TIGR00255 family)